MKSGFLLNIPPFIYLHLPSFTIFKSPIQSPMVHLRKKKLSSGKITLYLDFYINGQRHKEYLGITYMPRDRYASVFLHQAEEKRAEKELLIITGKLVTLKTSAAVSLFAYWQHFIATSKRKDVKVFKAALMALKCVINDMPIAELKTHHLEKYASYLKANFNGETPANYYKAAKRVLSQAAKEELLSTNPALSITIGNPVRHSLRKSVLWPDEIKKLSDTPCPNKDVKAAFLFATQTGLRPVDLYALTHDMIKKSPLGIYVEVQQSKTSVPLIVYLNESALSLIDLSKKGNLFTLPTMNGCNKAIRLWVEKAAINKHITFYCARHSAITNVLHATGNIKTASMIAGHTSTRHTERYTHVLNKQLKDAMDKISL